MTTQKETSNPSTGGAYVIDSKTGVRRRVEEPTKPPEFKPPKADAPKVESPVKSAKE